MDKKLLRLVLIFIGVIVFIIIFFAVIGSMGSRKAFVYSDVENSLVEAAKRYVKGNPKEAPQDSDDVVKLADTMLQEKGYMKKYDKLYKEQDILCKGYVNVYYVSEKRYAYLPYLDCGTKGEGINLSDQVIEDNEYGVVSGSGMYVLTKNGFVTDEAQLDSAASSEGTTYVFRGNQNALINNYVKLENMLWRIVEIDSEGNMLMIYDSYLMEYQPWDERYNPSVEDNFGINDYNAAGKKSNILQVIESFYDGKVELRNNQSFSYLIKPLSVPTTVCVGKRSTTETGYDGSVECKEKLEEQYVSLLPGYMFMRASLDDKCTTITSKNCQNLNYLADYNSYWLLTTDSENSHICYNVNGYVRDMRCSMNSGIKPLITLGYDTLFDTGNGTKESPYIIKSYVDEEKK